jgi:uncharacterized protein (TIRG00374 family)
MGEIAATLGSLKPVSAFGALVLTLVAWWLSALRLWCIAPQFRLRAVVQMTFVALFYGTVLPGQVAGDVMKAHRLRKTQAEPGQAVATTLVDRVVATFALFILGACATTLVREAPIELTLLFAAAAMVLFVGTTILAQARAHAFMMRWMRSDQPGGLVVLLGRFVDAMHRILQHPRRLLACLLLALVFHGLCTAIQIELAHAIGFELPAAVWLLVYSGVALLLLLPISVAGLGLREGGYVGLLGIFGVPASQALALSLMLFAYTLLGALLGWVADVIEQDER